MQGFVWREDNPAKSLGTTYVKGDRIIVLSEDWGGGRAGDGPCIFGLAARVGFAVVAMTPTAEPGYDPRIIRNNTKTIPVGSCRFVDRISEL